MSASGSKDTQCQSDLNNAAINNTMTSHEGSNAENFPDEDQGITVDASEGITLDECKVAIGKLIGPSNIRSASTSTEGRMCFYLSSQETVSKLLDAHKHVKIGNQILELRSLVPRYKMIVMTNIFPTVPHSIIEDELAEINISIKSQIYFKTAGIDIPGYEHIKSFERLVWVNADDVNKLSNDMQISFDDTVYRIHLQEYEGIDLYVKDINTLEQKAKETMLQLKLLPAPEENEGLNEQEEI